MTKEFSEEKDESLGQSTPPEENETELHSENGSLNSSQTEELPDPLIQCTEELAAEKDQRLRVAAEFANYRRRMESQRSDWSSRAKAGVIRSFLPILDDLERSLTAAEKTQSDDHAFVSLMSGLTLVMKNFSTELSKLGLTRIDTVGVPFDEHLHEAVGQAPAQEGQLEGHVLFESLSGYCLGDQVLRHAKVIVAIAPDPAVSEEAETNE